MDYLKTIWKNKPSSETPIDAGNLNKIEDAISFSVNRVSALATLNDGWSAGSALGLNFDRIGDLVISNFAATINDTSGMHIFIGTIPDGMRPDQITPLPAVFVPTGSSEYQPRMVMLNTNGTIQIANTPTETGTFFCAMVYFTTDTINV